VTSAVCGYYRIIAIRAPIVFVKRGKDESSKRSKKGKVAPQSRSPLPLAGT
jgi:hypothetical protein